MKVQQSLYNFVFLSSNINLSLLYSKLAAAIVGIFLCDHVSMQYVSASVCLVKMFYAEHKQTTNINGKLQARKHLPALSYND